MRVGAHDLDDLDAIALLVVAIRIAAVQVLLQDIPGEIVHTSHTDSGTAPDESTGTEYTDGEEVEYKAVATTAVQTIAYGEGKASASDSSSVEGSVVGKYFSFALAVTALATPTVTISNIIGGKRGTLTCPAGATCKYSVDNSDPAAGSGTSYSYNDGEYQEVKVATATLVIKTVAQQDGYVDSTDSKTDSVTAVAAPTITISAIPLGKKATITCPASATCNYATGGDTASETEGTDYTSEAPKDIPFTTVGSKQVDAIAFQSGFASTAATNSFTVTALTAPTATESDILKGKKLALTCVAGASCKYTLDGSTPDETSVGIAYADADTVDFTAVATTTVKLIAYQDGFVSSVEAGPISVAVTAAPVPTITPENIVGGKKAVLTCDATCTSCHQAEDATPDENSASYSDADELEFKTAATKVVNTVAYKSGFAPTTATSTIAVTAIAEPTITSTDIIGGKNVALTCPAGNGASACRFTNTGTAPDESTGDLYSDADNEDIKTASTTIYNTIAYESGYASATHTLSVAVDAVPEPTATVADILGGVKFSFACPTDCTCRWAEDSLPRRRLWTAVVIDETTGTLYDQTGKDIEEKTEGTYVYRTIAYRSGYASTEDDVTDSVGAPVTAPTITPADILCGKKVTLTCGDGATCRYTDSGTAPDESTGTVYTDGKEIAFTASVATVVKAIASKEGMESSSAQESVAVTSVGGVTVSPLLSEDTCSVSTGPQSFLVDATGVDVSCSLSGSQTGFEVISAKKNVVIWEIGASMIEFTAYEVGKANSSITFCVVVMQGKSFEEKEDKGAKIMEDSMAQVLTIVHGEDAIEALAKSIINQALNVTSAKRGEVVGQTLSGVLAAATAETNETRRTAVLVGAATAVVHRLAEDFVAEGKSGVSPGKMLSKSASEMPQLKPFLRNAMRNRSDATTTAALAKSTAVLVTAKNSADQTVVVKRPAGIDDDLVNITVTLYPCWLVTTDLTLGTCVSVELNGEHGNWQAGSNLERFEIDFPVRSESASSICVSKPDEFSNETWTEFSCDIKALGATAMMSHFSVFATNGGGDAADFPLWAWAIIGAAALSLLVFALWLVRRSRKKSSRVLPATVEKKG